MISKIDLGIIMFYLISMLVVGYYIGRKNETQEEYLTSKKSMPWIPVMLSIAATMISANSLIGGPGWAYNSGITPFVVNITVPFACFFASSITAPIIYKLKISSIYEYIELRFGGITRNIVVLQFLINSLIQVASMVFIPALIFQYIVKWNFKIIVVFIVLIAVLCTVIGGIKAVIWTDAVQSIIILVSLIFIILIPLYKLGMSPLDTIETLKNSGKLNVYNFNYISENNIFAGILGGTIMWIRYFSFDQVQVQRIATAKSMKGIKKSLMWSSFIMNITYFIILFIGLILWIYYGGKKFDSQNGIMINFIIKELPIGIIGLSIAGAIAAAISSIDSIVNSMVTVIITDIYNKYFNSKKEEKLKTTMIIASIIGIVVIMIVMLAFDNSIKSVLDLVGKYISYFTGPACAAFMLALFTKKANDKGVGLGIVSGFIISFIIIQKIKIFWLWNPAIGFVVTFILSYMLSILFINKEDIKEKEKYTALEIKKSILESGNIMENGESLLPFSIKKYEILILLFFIFQFVFLYIISD